MDERFARAYDAITWDMWNALPKEVKVYISHPDRQWERNWIALQNMRAAIGAALRDDVSVSGELPAPQVPPARSAEARADG